MFYRRGEYNLSRLEYEKALFGAGRRAFPGKHDASAKGLQERLRTKIGLTLIRSRQYRKSLFYLSGGSSFSLRYLRLYSVLRQGMLRGSLYEKARIESSSLYSPAEKDEARLLAGAIILENGAYQNAEVYFHNLSVTGKRPELRQIAEKTYEDIKKYKNIPRKSPLVAGVLSAILPGSGQYYAAHRADAFTAFYFNSLFIGSAAVTYNLERAAGHKPGASVFFGVIGLFFYITNIIGGVGSAKRWNLYQERKFQQQIRDRFLNIDYAEKQSGVSFRTGF